jgi:hypothetical protein
MKIEFVMETFLFFIKKRSAVVDSDLFRKNYTVFGWVFLTSEGGVEGKAAIRNSCVIHEHNLFRGVFPVKKKRQRRTVVRLVRMRAFFFSVLGNEI